MIPIVTTNSVIEHQNGSTANGTLTITPSQSFRYGAIVVAQSAIEYAIANGKIVDANGNPATITLHPTSSALGVHSLTGLFYNAQYHFSDGASSRSEMWLLPDSITAPIEITDIPLAAATTAVVQVVEGPAGPAGGVAGPQSTVADRIAVFFDGTGQIIKDGLMAIADLLNTDNHTDGTVNGVFTLANRTQLAALATDKLDVVTAVRTISGTTLTLLAADNSQSIECTNAGAVALTLPAGLGKGFSCALFQTGAGAVTPVAAAGVTMHIKSGTGTSGQYSVMTIFAIAADVFIVSGDLA